MNWLCKHIMSRVSRFAVSDDGAVTVDFVVLAGAVIGMVIVITTNLGTSVHDQAGRIDRKMTSVGVWTTY